jgi:hypothetical protein
VDEWSGTTRKKVRRAKRLINKAHLRWWEYRMLEILNARFRYIVSFLLAAVIFAGVLRHTAHVYAGFSRAEIREGALIGLMAVVAVSVVLIFWRRRRRG